MIRRDAVDDAGRPCWVLISQIEHARAAGELARNWQAGDGRPLGERRELIAAIFHHDDGWADWERSPQVDRTSGRPLSFTEMPLASSLQIWQASIDAATSVGPLAAWLVAGHFAALLRNSTHADAPAARRWLEETQSDQHARSADWRRAQVDGDYADTALGYLQAFDLLSLWLCCAERHEPYRLLMPAGGLFTLTPSGVQTVGLAPWPLTVASLSLEIHGRSIPQSHYPDAAALAAVAGTPTVLRYNFTP